MYVLASVRDPIQKYCICNRLLQFLTSHCNMKTIQNSFFSFFILHSLSVYICFCVIPKRKESKQNWPHQWIQWAAIKVTVCFFFFVLVGIDWGSISLKPHTHMKTNKYICTYAKILTQFPCKRFLSKNNQSLIPPIFIFTFTGINKTNFWSSNKKVEKQFSNFIAIKTTLLCLLFFFATSNAPELLLYFCTCLISLLLFVLIKCLSVL